MNAFFKLRQNKKRLSKYFMKIKWIKKNVFAKLKSIIIKRLINKLNDDMIKRIVNPNLKYKKNKILKKTIKTIEKIANINDVEKLSCFIAIQKNYIVIDELFDKNRIFFKFLKKQIKITQYSIEIQFEIMKKILKMINN